MPGRRSGGFAGASPECRPEVVAQAAEIARKQVQVRQERLRPFLPTLAVDFSDGVFGGGTNRADLVPVHPQFGRFANRTDFDVMAWWTLANLGLGNRAVQKERRAEQVQAVFEQDRIIDVMRGKSRRLLHRSRRAEAI